MKNSEEIETIDLTSPNYNTSNRYPTHRHQIEEVIEFIELNDSVDDEPKNLSANKKKYPKEKPDNCNNSSVPKKRRKVEAVGFCSICWEDFGSRPLASTKCGHVFCIVCLEKCLQVDKRCPKCRRNVKSKLGYHPIYL